MAELAVKVGLAIPDFEGYKTSRLRGVPRGVSRNGFARPKGIETARALRRDFMLELLPATGSPVQRALKRDCEDDEY